MNIAVILAGGVGSRVGADVPKQFIEIEGKPVLAYTVDKFQKHPMIDAVEIVCIESYIGYMEEMRDKYKLDKIKYIAKGGATFQESVMNGIEYLDGKISDDDTVLVHFGASPFVEEEIITDAINVCKEKGNAISTTSFFYLSALKDTPDAKETHEYIDRDSIACMNSPHAFKYSLVRDLYRDGVKTGAIDKVEPHTTSLMQYMNIPIYFSKGLQTNIKITTKEDLDLFEGYVLLQKKRHTKYAE